MDKGYFFFSKFTRAHQPVFQSLIHGKCVFLRRVGIAENCLRCPRICTVYLNDFFSAESYLAAVKFLGFRIKDTGVESAFSNVATEKIDLLSILLDKLVFDFPSSLDSLICL